MSPSIPHLYSHNLPETCSYSMEYNSLTVRDNQYFQETVSKIERHKSCTRLTQLCVKLNLKSANSMSKRVNRLSHILHKMFYILHNYLFNHFCIQSLILQSGIGGHVASLQIISFLDPKDLQLQVGQSLTHSLSQSVMFCKTKTLHSQNSPNLIS